MKDIDELITRSLSEDEAAEFKRLGEQGLFEKVAETYRGKSSWLAMLATVYKVLFFGVGIYAIVQFTGATEVGKQILWSSIAIVSLISVGIIKLWFWMELNRNSVMREIKRLELQIDLLSAERNT